MGSHQYDEITPPREGAVRVPIAEEPGIDVELGANDIGVWLGLLYKRGGRRWTIAVGESGARALARTLIQAADASSKNRERDAARLSAAARRLTGDPAE